MTSDLSEKSPAPLRLFSVDRKTLRYLPALLLAAFLGVFFLYPLFLAVKAGFQLNDHWSFYWFGRVLTDARTMGQFGNGLMVAAITTLVCFLLTMPLALVATRCEFPGRVWINGLVLLPLILPPFVGAVFVRNFIGQFGILNTILENLGIIKVTAKSLPPDWLGSGFAGVVILQSLHLFPIMYLNLATALANINPSYAQAARNLGAGPWKTFFKVTLPLLRPGIFAGGCIVFVWAFTDIGTPLMVGYDHMPAVSIYKDLTQANFSPKTYGVTSLLLLVSVTLYYLSKTVFRSSTPDDAVKASISSEARRLKGWSVWLVWTGFGLLIAIAILPHVGVILTAISNRWVDTVLPQSYTLRHLKFVLTRPETFQCIINSLKYAGVSTLVDIILGTVAAWLIVRGKIKGATMLDGLMMMPLAVPGVILAAGFVALTAPGTTLEAIGPMRNPFWIIIIAYSVRRMPFVIRGLVSGLEQIPVALEESARNLGATVWGAMRLITAPLVLSNMIAAGVLTFSFAMLEVSDSLVLAQTEGYYPITKEIYRQAMSANTDAYNIAAAMGVYGMIVLTLALGSAALLMGRRLGAIFRF